MMLKDKLRKRFESFCDGRGEELIRESQANVDEANAVMLWRRWRRLTRVNGG